MGVNVSCCAGHDGWGWGVEVKYEEVGSIGAGRVGPQLILKKQVYLESRLV